MRALGVAERRRDIGVLVVLFLFSTSLYVWRLGFYSDDWSFLYALHLKAAPSYTASLTRFLREDLPARPMQALVLVTFFRWFGTNPVPFHLANTLIVATSVVLFFLTLLRAGVTRSIALAAAALYGLVPQYSTDRFWIAAMQAPLSIALYSGFVLSGFEALDVTGSARRAFWVASAVILLAASILSYEVVAPLTPLVAWLWLRHARLHGRPRPIVLATTTLAAFAGLSLYKAAVTTRMDHPNGWYAYARWIAHTAVTPHYRPADGGFNAYWALYVNYVQNGILLPLNALRVALEMPTAHLASITTTALATGALGQSCLQRPRWPPLPA